MTNGSQLVQVPSSGSSSPWLFGPWFDLLFIANLLWPVVFVAQFADGFVGQTGIKFWQVYFVTTPHRWITLVLVFLDREQFRAKQSWFVGIALLVIVICSAVQWTTGTITCLLAIDYLWNAWHFAAQHHGVYRIYSRLDGSRPLIGGLAEKIVMRAFLLYVIVRVAGETFFSSSTAGRLSQIDYGALLVPFGFLVREAIGFSKVRLGRAAYLVSVMALYAALLWAVHIRRSSLILSLTTASALFHAIEYLAIVGWSVKRRHAQRGDMLGMLATFAPRWGITVLMFAVILGSAGWMMDHQLLEVWLFINVIVAFLHYAYDGLIWKRPKSKPANVAPSPASQPMGAAT